MSYSNGRLILTLQQEKIALEKKQAAGQVEIQRLQRVMDMLVDLYWAAQKIRLEDDILQALDLLHYRALETITATDGSILVFDEETESLAFWIVQGQVRDQLTGFTMAAETGVAGWVLETGYPVSVDNPGQDWRFSRQVDGAFSFATRSILCVPIADGEGRRGVIQFLNKSQEHPFDEVDMTLALVLADVVARGLAELRARSLTPVQP